MKTMRIYSLFLIAALSLSSCTTRLMDLTLTSSKNFDLSNSKGYTVASNSRARGSDTKQIIFIFPSGTPSIKEAMDRAIEKAGDKAVALSNMTLESTSWYIPLIYGRVTFTVEGDPVYKK